MKESKSAFAARLGVSPSYVTKLGDEGRLVMDGRLVDVEATLARIDATKDPNRDDVRQRHAFARDQKRLAVANPSPVAAISEPGEGEDATDGQESPKTPKTENDPVGNDSEDRRKARAKKMYYEARYATTRLAKRKGLLPSRGSSRRFGVNEGASLRAMFENTPDRAAPVLAPVRDPAGAASVLGKLLEDIETELADMLTKHIAEMRETTS